MHLSLIPHPNTPPDDAAMSLEVWLERWPDGRAELSYHLHSAPGGLVLPTGVRGRTDGLWNSTCFEFFVEADDGYREYNFAPSGAWAAYAFDGYRSGMRLLELDHDPEIEFDLMEEGVALDAVIDLASHGRFGLSAVIEEASGTKSYWALAHPPGNPDFHHPACFAATLPPIGAE